MAGLWDQPTAPRRSIWEPVGSIDPTQVAIENTGSFGRGLRSSAVGQLGSVQRYLGANEAALANQQEAARWAPDVQTTDQIEDFSTGAQYVAGQLGAGAASLPVGLAGGVAGRVLGGARGAYLGATAAYQPVMAGGHMQELDVAQPGMSEHDKRLRATGVGTAQAVLEGLAPGHVINHLAKPAALLKPGLLPAIGRAGKVLATDAALEGLAAAGSDVIGQGSLIQLDPTLAYNPRQTFEAGVGEAIGGAGMGAVHAPLAVAHDYLGEGGNLAGRAGKYVFDKSKELAGQGLDKAAPSAQKAADLFKTPAEFYAQHPEFSELMKDQAPPAGMDMKDVVGVNKFLDEDGARRSTLAKQMAQRILEDEYSSNEDKHAARSMLETDDVDAWKPFTTGVHLRQKRERVVDALGRFTSYVSGKFDDLKGKASELKGKASQQADLMGVKHNREYTSDDIEFFKSMHSTLSEPTGLGAEELIMPLHALQKYVLDGMVDKDGAVDVPDSLIEALGDQTAPAIAKAYAALRRQGRTGAIDEKAPALLSEIAGVVKEKLATNMSATQVIKHNLSLSALNSFGIELETFDSTQTDGQAAAKAVLLDAKAQPDERRKALDFLNTHALGKVRNDHKDLLEGLVGKVRDYVLRGKKDPRFEAQFDQVFGANKEKVLAQIAEMYKADRVRTSIKVDEEGLDEAGKEANYSDEDGSDRAVDNYEEPLGKGDVKANYHFGDKEGSPFDGDSPTLAAHMKRVVDSLDTSRFATRTDKATLKDVVHTDMIGVAQHANETGDYTLLDKLKAEHPKMTSKQLDERFQILKTYDKSMNEGEAIDITPRELKIPATRDGSPNKASWQDVTKIGSKDVSTIANGRIYLTTSRPERIGTETGDITPAVKQGKEFITSAHRLIEKMWEKKGRGAFDERTSEMTGAKDKLAMFASGLTSLLNSEGFHGEMKIKLADGTMQVVNGMKDLPDDFVIWHGKGENLTLGEARRATTEGVRELKDTFKDKETGKYKEARKPTDKLEGTDIPTATRSELLEEHGRIKKQLLQDEYARSTSPKRKAAIRKFFGEDAWKLDNAKALPAEMREGLRSKLESIEEASRDLPVEVAKKEIPESPIVNPTPARHTLRVEIARRKSQAERDLERDKSVQRQGVEVSLAKKKTAGNIGEREVARQEDGKLRGSRKDHHGIGEYEEMAASAERKYQNTERTFDELTGAELHPKDIQGADSRVRLLDKRIAELRKDYKAVNDKIKEYEGKQGKNAVREANLKNWRAERDALVEKGKKLAAERAELAKVVPEVSTPQKVRDEREKARAEKVADKRTVDPELEAAIDNFEKVSNEFLRYGSGFMDMTRFPKSPAEILRDVSNVFRERVLKGEPLSEVLKDLLVEIRDANKELQAVKAIANDHGGPSRRIGDMTQGEAQSTVDGWVGKYSPGLRVKVVFTDKLRDMMTPDGGRGPLGLMWKGLKEHRLYLSTRLEDASDLISILAHEYGHAMWHHEFDNASPGVQKSLRDAHARDVAHIDSGKSTVGEYNQLFGMHSHFKFLQEAIEESYYLDMPRELVGEHNPGLKEIIKGDAKDTINNKQEIPTGPMRQYSMSFDEWMANQFAKFVINNGESHLPLPAHNFIRKMVERLKEFFGEVISKLTPATEFSDFVKELGGKYGEKAEKADPGVKYNKEQLGKEGDNAKNVDAIAEIHRLIGKDVDAAFATAGALKGSATWTRDPKTGKAIIRIAANALDPMSMAYHESMHEFFQRLLDDKRGHAAGVLQQAADSKLVLRQMMRHFQHEAEVLKQLEADPAERVAYMYQLWAAGKLHVGPQTETVFRKIINMVRKVFGLMTADKKALEIMMNFSEGNMSDRNAMAKLLDTQEARGAYLRKVGTVMKPVLDGTAKWAGWAENTLLDSGNPALVEIGKLFNNKTGSQNADIGYLQAHIQAENKWMNKFATVFREYEKADVDMALDHLQKQTSPADPIVKDIYDRVHASLEEMHTYLEASGVKRFDEDKQVWVPLGKLENYFPVSWDSAKLISDGGKFIKLLSEHHSKELEAIAKQANDEVAAGKDAGKGTASWAKLANKDAKPVTADDVAVAIMNRLIGSNGQAAFQETDSTLGFSPFMKAVNQRTLNWIDQEVFHEFQEKDMARVISSYVGQSTKRAEYSKRFGPDGGKLQNLMEKGWHHEIDKIMLEKYKVEGAVAKALEAVDKGKGETTFEAELAKLAGEGVEGEAITGEALEKLEPSRKAVMAMEGSLGSDISPLARKANAFSIVYQNTRLLAYSLFSNFIDPLGIMVRGGEAKDAYAAFKRGMRDVFRTWGDLTGLREAKPGDIDEATRVAEMVGTVDTAGFMNTIGSLYGSQYLPEWARNWNDNFFRWNGMESYNKAMRVQATQAAISFIKRHYEKPNEHSERYFKELVLERSDVKIAEDGSLNIESPQVQRAIMLWVDGAVLRPNAAIRPVMASDPHYATFYHLKQFMYAMHAILLKRVQVEIKNGNTDPLMVLMAGFIPTMLVADTAKGLLQEAMGAGAPAWTHESLGGVVKHGVERAGLLGVGQMGMDIVNYGPAGLLGPMVEQVADVPGQSFGENVKDAVAVGPLQMALKGTNWDS